MKLFARWLGRVFCSVLSMCLIVVLFPYLSQFAKSIMPDEAGSAIRTSAVLATRLEDSARLETMKVCEDGVICYDIKAAFVGTVATVNVSYTYEASFGIDLSKVQMQVSRNRITFYLPAPELIQDSLTPIEVYKDDFWYPGFTEQDYFDLLEKERLTRREDYLYGSHRAVLITSSQTAFETTISSWMKNLNKNVEILYVHTE